MPLTAPLAAADLLAPIPGAAPGGVDLRYDPLFDQIREARREDDDAPQGEWRRERKTADPSLVIRLATQALATRTKDLQIAVWLTEALARRDGLAGLRGGLELLDGLLRQWWDELLPPLEDGDAELRVAPLEWLALRVHLPLLQLPLTAEGHGLLVYRAAQAAAAAAGDGDGDGSSSDAGARGGEPTLEVFDAAVAATPKGWYRERAGECAACLQALDALERTGDERFGALAPGYGRLRGALEDVGDVLRQLLARKLALDPDPEPAPGQEPESGPVAASADGSGDLPSGGPAGGLAAAPVAGDRAQAAVLVAAAARALRRLAPTDPAGYLLARALRWGELRAAARLEPRMLEAPSTATRTRLRGLLLDRQWVELLDAAEEVTASAAGRGWLDVQRYAATAVRALGPAYAAVAEAMDDALRAHLRALPDLPGVTLMDDTPTANAETQAWLAESGLAPGAGAGGIGAGGIGAGGIGVPAGGGRMEQDGEATALALPPGGATPEVIDVLLREAERERSPRGRFVRRVRLAGAMVEGGLDAVARPILEELVAQIDAQRLEAWERGDLVARPLALLYRCLERRDEDAGLRQQLYLRICRLDPLQAMALTPGAPAA